MISTIVRRALVFLGAMMLAGVVGRALVRRIGGPSEARAEFLSRYRRALANPQLRANLVHYQRTWKRQRNEAFAAYQERTGRDFQTMREKLAAVKGEMLAEMPRYFQQFKESAERAGAVVYQAKSPEDVHRYILDLASRHDVSLVIKAKSMVSEEIHLNHALERERPASG